MAGGWSCIRITRGMRGILRGGRNQEKGDSLGEMERSMMGSGKKAKNTAAECGKAPANNPTNPTSDNGSRAASKASVSTPPQKATATKANSRTPSNKAKEPSDSSQEMSTSGATSKEDRMAMASTTTITGIFIRGTGVMG